MHYNLSQILIFNIVKFELFLEWACPAYTYMYTLLQ